MSNTETKIVTKEDERKALAKIKKIVESLGEDSYIGVAFEGLFEVAEQNIDNDWFCSLQQKIEIYEKQNDEFEIRIEELKSELEEEKRLHALQLENFRTCMSNCETYKAEIEELRSDLKSAEDEISELDGDLNKSEETVVQLKARLFDLLYE